MPAVRILVSVAGAHIDWAPGDIVEMSADDAAKWADDRRAELVKEAPKPKHPRERAVRQNRETR